MTSGDLSPLLQEVDQFRGELSRESAQVALEIRGVLTPEQLAKAAQHYQRLGELRTEVRKLLRGRTVVADPERSRRRRINRA